MSVKEDLELNIGEALKAVKILDAALTAAAKQFKASLVDATSVLTNVKVTFNQADIKKNFDAAAKGAAPTISPKIDTKQLNEQLNLFTATKPKFEQLSLPLDTTAATKALKDTANASDDLAEKAKVNFSKAGSAAMQAGQIMTVGLTLPLVAAGAAAVKTGNEFELAFSRMVGLANVPAQEVERLRDGVLSLSGETGRSANELAEALYFINSSGIAAGDSIAVLDFAAKGAAAGLGRTKDVADVVTSVINAYGKENISAAQATDILTQAVRDGKGEPDAFAQVLGRVVPTAAKLGVEFDQVAAALATMTRTGLSASEASVSLNQVFNSLLNTTKEGEEILNATFGKNAKGISGIAFLRDELAKPNGLLNVMRLLDQSFQGNLETLDKVIPNIRALRGFLNILAQDAGNVNTIFSNTNAQLLNTNESLGATQEAYAAYAATTQASVDKAKQAVTNSFIQIGALLAPLVEDLASFVGGVATLFAGLSDGQQKVLLAFAAVLAAIGPVLIVMGSLINSVTAIIKLGPALAAVFTNPYFIAGAAILTVLSIAFLSNAQNAYAAEARVRSYTTAIRETGDVAAGVTKVLEGMFKEGKNAQLLEALDAADIKVEAFSQAVETGGVALDTVRQKLTEAFAADRINPELQRKLETLSGKTLPEIISLFVAGKTPIEIFGDELYTQSNRGAGSVSAFADRLYDLNHQITENGVDVAKASKEADVLNRVIGNTGESAEASSDQLSLLPPDLQQIVIDAANAAASTDDLSNSLDTLAKSMPSIGSQVAEGAGAILSGIGGASNAYASLAAQAKETTKATGGAAKATKDAAKEAEAAVQANQKYEDSLVSVEKAQRRLLDAQTALTTASKGPSNDDRQSAINRAKSTGIDIIEATEKLKKEEETLKELRASNVKEDRDKIAEQERAVFRAQIALSDAFISQRKAQADSNKINSFDPKKDEDVAKAREGVADAETALQKALRESNDALQKINTSTEEVTKTESGRATQIKEKYIPTIEDLTAKMAETYTNNLLFFQNIKTLVERGADDLAGAIIGVAKTDKDAAIALAAQAVGLTDDRLGEQERLIEETNKNNAGLAADSKTLFEDVIRGATTVGDQVPRQFANAYGTIRSNLQEAEDVGAEVGDNLGSGVDKGLFGFVGKIKDRMREVIREAKKAADEEADSHSPSKLFAKVGDNLGAGLVLGMQAQERNLARTAAGLVRASASAAVGAATDLPVGGLALGSATDAGLAQLIDLLKNQSGFTQDLDFNVIFDQVPSAAEAEAATSSMVAAAERLLAQRGISFDVQRGVRR